MFRTAAVALTITLLAASQISFAQSPTSEPAATTQPATRPSTQPLTQPDAKAAEVKLPQLTDEQRDKIAALWEKLLAADRGDEEAFANAWKGMLDEKDLTVALLNEQFVEAKLSKEAVAKLIADLDSDVWKKREGASRKLMTKGFSQADLVQAAIESAQSPETRERLKEINKAHEQRLWNALVILIRIDSEASWATARCIAKVKDGSGNAKIVSLSVEAFVKDIHSAAWLLYNEDYEDVKNRISAPDYEASQEDLRVCAFIDNLSIPVDDKNSPMALMNMAIKLAPDNSICYVRRGLLLNYLGRNNEAYADFTMAIEISPKESFPYFMRGRLLLNTKRPKEAAADFTKAIELKPDDARNYMARADAYELFDENEKAIADIDEAIRLDDRSRYQTAWWYCRKSRLKNKLGRMEKAVADLKKAIEIGEGTYMYSFCCNELAWLYVNCEDPARRDMKAAMEYSLKACKAIPDKETYLDTLACIYAENGQWDKAIETQKKAIANTDDEDELKPVHIEHLEGFKNHKTLLQQEAEKKKNAASATQPTTQPAESNATPTTTPAEQ